MRQVCMQGVWGIALIGLLVGSFVLTNRVSAGTATVKPKEGTVEYDNVYDHASQEANGEYEPQSTQAQVVNFDGNTTYVESVSFQPPQNWAFVPGQLPNGAWTYVDLLPDSIGGIPAEPDPANSDQHVRVWWLNLPGGPESADHFGLRTEGNLRRITTGGGTGGDSGDGGQHHEPKKYHWAAKVETAVIDLDIDSNNNNAYSKPERSSIEDVLEETTGIKVIVVNRDDDDNDLIPDYADGFNGVVQPDGGEINEQEKFVPIILQVSPSHTAQNTKIRFTYDVALPGDMQQTAVSHEGFDAVTRTAFAYSAGSGKLRIWLKDGNESRTEADCVASGEDIMLSDLPFDDEGIASLYLEGVSGHSSALNIQVELIDSLASASVSTTDTVQVLVVDPDAGVDSSIQIEGYTIIDGGSHVNGGDGNDIIIGTHGDDVINTGDGDDIVLAGDGYDEVRSTGGSDYGVVIFGGGSSGDGATREDGGGSDLFVTEGSEEVQFEEGETQYSVDDILAAYDAMFDLDNPIYQAWENAGRGNIYIKPAVGSFLGDVLADDLGEVSQAVFTKRNGKQHCNIYIEGSIKSPVIAAQVLHARLRDAVLSPWWIGDKNGDMYAEFWNNLFNDQLIHSYTNGLDDNVDEVVSLYYEVTYGEMVKITAAAAELYLEGIAMISIGADIALAVNDITTGHYASGTFALMLVGLPHVPGQGVVFKKGSEVLGKIWRKIEDIPGYNNIVSFGGQQLRGQAALEHLDNLYEAANPSRTSYVGASFVANDKARRIKLAEDIVVFQYGEAAGQAGGYGTSRGGHYVTPQVLDADEARRKLALPDNNPATDVKVYVIKKDTEITIGEVADMSDNTYTRPDGTRMFHDDATGGGIQFYVDDTADLVPVVINPDN